jgi:hypothetical protein
MNENANARYGFATDALDRSRRCERFGLQKELGGILVMAAGLPVAQPLLP